jgi:glyoxylate reductase
MTHTLPKEWLTALEGKCQIIKGPIDATKFDTKLMEYLSEADGLFTLLNIPIDKTILDKAPKLRVVSNMAVGYDNIDVGACTARGIPVGNTPGVLTDGTADLTMALLLTIARNLNPAHQDARNGLWKTWTPTGWLGADLKGAHLGIIGLGKIGEAVAKRALGFGLKILYYNQKRKLETEKSLGVIYSPLEELLRESDFVSIHVPLTPGTRHLINAERLQWMKPTAILINTARGGIVNTTDLITALEKKWIAAAGLDVTDPEPLPPDHPLWKLPNCFITPHIGSATRYTRKRMAELACENLIAGLENRTLPYCVNLEVYKTNIA